MILQYGGIFPHFPFHIQICIFHLLLCSFAPDWDEVGRLHSFHLFQSISEQPYHVILYTHFPSELISYHMNVKQKRSLLLLILFVSLWSIFFFLLWFSCETNRFISSNFKYVKVGHNLVWLNHCRFPDSSMEKSKDHKRAIFLTCFRKIRHLSLVQIYWIPSSDWCLAVEAQRQTLVM